MSFAAQSELRATLGDSKTCRGISLSIRMNYDMHMGYILQGLELDSDTEKRFSLDSKHSKHWGISKALKYIHLKK